MTSPRSTPRSLGRRLRFQQLELLSEVAVGGTLGQAAARLHISRAAVSKSIKELEATLGFSLFERSSNGMAPTAAGMRIIEHARLLMHEFGRLTDEADTLTGKPNSDTLGQLRIGAPPFVTERLMPNLLVELRRRTGSRNPTVHLVEGRLNSLIEQLLLGELDAILTLFSPRAVDSMDLSMLEIRQVTEVAMQLVAAPSLLKSLGRQRRKPSWEQLLTQPWILPPATTHLRRTVDELFNAHGHHAPRSLIESPSLSANVRMAVEGLGVAVVPEVSAHADIQAGRLRVLDFPQPLAPTTIALIYRKASVIYREVIRHLSEAALTVKLTA